MLTFERVLEIFADYLTADETIEVYISRHGCVRVEFGVAVLITYSPQNGVILLVMAFLISPMGLPLAAIWLLGKVQSLKFAIQDWVYG